jgi:hypothetical protein
MAELKFNKVPGMEYWLTEIMEDEISAFRFRIIKNNFLYSLDLIEIENGKAVNHGEFDFLDQAIMHAEGLMSDDLDAIQQPDYGFIWQCIGILAVIAIGVYFIIRS